ncbi:hypothetical protein WMY93_031459 [Mugilogobius chulae]|uniref:Uncharacterized protein n=1 Tax=Mugilogobius chulae TaxID=88201 RepID=A0AAW0MI15_9GOBI
MDEREKEKVDGSEGRMEEAYASLHFSAATRRTHTTQQQQHKHKHGAAALLFSSPLHNLIFLRTMTMSSVSVVVAVVQQNPQQQQHSGLTQDPQLRFGVKKSILPRKTSWEKMVFRRSSIGDKSQPEAAATARLSGGFTPRERCQTSDRLADIAASGSHDLPVKRCVDVVVTNGHSSTNTKGNCRKQQNGHADSCKDEDVFGNSLPILERVTQGKTGVVKLARTETHRRQAWEIFPSASSSCPGRDPRVKMETGEGHRFEARAVRQDWCDACNCQVQTQALKCRTPSLRSSRTIRFTAAACGSENAV